MRSWAPPENSIFAAMLSAGECLPCSTGSGDGDGDGDDGDGDGGGEEEGECEEGQGKRGNRISRFCVLPTGRAAEAQWQSVRNDTTQQARKVFRLRSNQLTYAAVLLTGHVPVEGQTVSELHLRRIGKKKSQEEAEKLG